MAGRRWKAVLRLVRTIVAFEKFDTLVDMSESQECILRDMFYSFEHNGEGRISYESLFELLDLVRFAREGEEASGEGKNWGDDVEKEEKFENLCNEEIMQMLPGVLPNYVEAGVSFNQFVYIYNNIMDLANKAKVRVAQRRGNKELQKRRKRESTSEKKNPALLSRVARKEALKTINRLYFRHKITENQRLLLETIVEPTKIHSDYFDHEQQFIEMKAKLAGILNLYKETPCKYSTPIRSDPPAVLFPVFTRTNHRPL